MGKLTINIKNFFREVKRKRVLFLMILPVVVYFIVFAYIPMPGAYIAFVDYSIGKGIFGSHFVGLKNFEFLAKTGDLWRITKNTLLYNLAFLTFCNLFQVAFAIMISELSGKWFKKVTQSVILLPYFISMVIVGFFAYNLFNYDHGFINTLLANIGLDKHDFYADQSIWKYIIVFFKVWSQTGYGMIIYLATITGISSDIYEAAALDGASPVQKIRYITIPLLKATVILLFLFGLGGILKGSFDLFYNLIGNNSVLFPQTDIIDTFVFRSLVGQFNFSQGAAVGFYQSIFGLVLVLFVNTVVKKIEPDSALF
ncbi:ABC transporter permease [Anaerocolumna sp. MB42-C2]|uniref:ABC transporter permease n=1 Tax=Anaerocolumna sp. MB42-C2 TaxID=3070997 RepID=UPI0027E16B8D|nr:DUF898 family protein [Anaerocolumna sp. MB42-C2]WMJ86720.1 ABC transporter permease subunit [Anaerocolumna sp. MB42-C2]